MLHTASGSSPLKLAVEKVLKNYMHKVLKGLWQVMWSLSKQSKWNSIFLLAFLASHANVSYQRSKIIRSDWAVPTKKLQSSTSYDDQATFFILNKNAFVFSSLLLTTSYKVASSRSVILTFQTHTYYYFFNEDELKVSCQFFWWGFAWHVLIFCLKIN